MTLGASEAEGLMVLHVGACGSGKTYRLKARVAAACRTGWTSANRGRFVILDVKREWPMVDGSLERGPLLSGSPAISMGACHVPPKDAARWPELVICRPRGSEATDEEAGRAWCDRVCRAALERGSAIVVAPEVYRYAREGYRMAPGLEELAHEHRHRACGVWCDVQSFAEVKKELVKRMGWIYIHGTGAYEDLGRLERMGGRGLAAAVLEAQRRNVSGSPGHHVVFRTADPLQRAWPVLDGRGRVVVVVGADGRIANERDSRARAR